MGARNRVGIGLYICSTGFDNRTRGNTCTVCISACPSLSRAFLYFVYAWRWAVPISIILFLKRGDFVGFFLIFMYVIQHCFICPSPPPQNPLCRRMLVSIPELLRLLALTARRSNHPARSHHLYLIRHYQMKM
jgi:hypothetical protein